MTEGRGKREALQTGARRATARVEQMQIALPRQPIDAAVDARQDVGTLVPVEQVVDEEPDFALGHDARADRSPPVRQREACQLLRLGAVTEPARRLRRVEVDVPALLLHDAPQELAQRRVPRRLGQPGVAGLGRPLVDGAPRHVQGDEGPAREGGRGDGAERAGRLAPPAPVAQRGDARRTRLLAVGLEHLPDGLAVPHLLEDPAGEEGGDRRVLVGRRQQEVAQVADGVVLDVVHVAQRAQRVGGQRLVPEVIEVDALQVQAARPGLVGVDGGSHSAYYSEPRLRPDGRNSGHPKWGAAPNRSDMPRIDEVSDAQLVTSIARYSEVALAEAYRRHGGAVFGLAKRVLNNPTDAEDVTQEVFLRLWNQPDRFDPARGSLRSFLLAQAHGRAVDAVRSSSSRRQREARDALRTAEAAYDMQREVWDLAVADQVASAMGELPEEERRAIELAYFDGRTYREVAQLLDQPEGTVKSRIRNGMRRMRAVLADAGVRGVDA